VLWDTNCTDVRERDVHATFYSNVTTGTSFQNLSLTASTQYHIVSPRTIRPENVSVQSSVVSADYPDSIEW